MSSCHNLSYSDRLIDPPNPPREKQLDAVVTSRCDCCPCRGCKCGRQRDAAVLGKRLINHQAVPVFDARRCSVVYIKHGGRRAAPHFQVPPSPNGKWVSMRSNPLRSPLTRRLCLFCGQEPGGSRNSSTFTLSPSMNSTFAEAAGTARRSSAGQQKVGLWGFERRDPSIIIPNHPTVHPNALLTPTASTHSYCPCAASRSMVGVEAVGGAAAGPRIIFSLPVAQHQVVVSGGSGRRRFSTFAELVALALQFSAAKRLGRGSGGLACAGQTL